MTKSTFHAMILRLFASPIMQTLYQTDRYSNELIDTKNMENNELQQSLIFIEKLIQNQAFETYQLLSTYYDIENPSILLHKDLIIEILKWSYDTDKYLGKELLNTKHFSAPVFDILSHTFISFVIEPIHIINIWILIIFYIMPRFLSLCLLIMDKKYKLFDYNSDCSVYDYIVAETMQIQYFLTIIHLLLCQTIFFINALMPLRSFVRWRRYYIIYLNHHDCGEYNINYELDDYEAMKLLLYPYQKLTLHGKITNMTYMSDLNDMNDNINEFTWAEFAASYTLYLFHLYIYNIWAVMYNENHVFVRKISYYECIVFIIYILPLIFALFILDKKYIKQRINTIYKWNGCVGYVAVMVLSMAIGTVGMICLYFDAYGYIYMLLDFLSYLCNFIHILACTIVGYIHVEWTIRHVYTSMFFLKSSLKQNMLILSNTIAITVWILFTKG